MSETGRLPYPGLRAYERDESDLFFGREGCVDEMVDRLAATRFLAVLGASGSGKSSLVRTGLLDALEIGLLAAAGPLWVVADCHPGGSAFRNLAENLLSATDAPAPSEDAIDTLETFLRRGPRSIVEWTNDGHLPAGHNLLVLVDQFEELFRYGDYAGREEAEAFAALLLESIRTPGRIYVVITMRSEYLGACALIPGLAEQINSSLYLTRRMTREECREAIEGPAGVIGFAIEPALVSQILNDMAALAPWEQDRENSQLQRLSRQADQLPLMQHALSRLWQLARRRQPSAAATLTLQDYLDIGMLQGALDQHAKEVVSRLAAPTRPLVRRTFRALVAGTDLSDAVRKPMRLADLAEAVSTDLAEVRDVVDAFRARDCNFLRPSGGHALSDDTVIDISHESLIRQWSDLSKWFDEEARASALWSRLLYREERHAAGEGELQSGLDLANDLAWWEREQPTRGWANSHGGKFDEIDRYLKDSREAEEKHVRSELQRARRERRRLQTTSFAILCFAIVCLVLASVAFRSYLAQEAANKNAQQAAAEARAANKMSSDAYDKFVVGDAESMQKISAIPYEVVIRRLDEGRAFLAGLAENLIDRQRIDLSQAKLLAVNGEILRDSGQPSAALSLVTNAEKNLSQDVTRSGLADDRDLLLMKFGATAILSDIDLRQYQDAKAAALQELQWADARKGSDPTTVFEQAKARFYLMYALAWTDAWQDALKYAGQCLDYLDRPGLADIPERDYYHGRCNMDYGFIIGKLQPKDTKDQHFALAVQDFASIKPELKTTAMVIEQSKALSNLASTYQEAGDTKQALNFYQQAEQTVDLSPVDLKQNILVRSMLIQQANRLGEFYDSIKDRNNAEIWFKKAISVGMADNKWHDLPDMVDKMADKIDTAMGNLEADLAHDSDTNPASLKDYAASKQEHVALREYLIRSGRAAWCQGCLLLDEEDEMAALMRFDPVRKEDRYDPAIKLADHVISEATAALTNPTSERTVINARRAWFWTVQALPDEPEDMPSVSGLANPTERINGQIARLTASKERLSAFLKAFPGVFLTERHLGIVDGNLAKLFASADRKDDAIAAAEAGVALFDRTSLDLLAGWYRTGSGPIPADPVKAADYARTLGSRRWDMTHLIVHHARPLYQDRGDIDVDFYIEDPRFDGDDPIARSIHQVEDIEGVKLKDATKSALENDFKEAKEKNISLTEIALQNVGSAVTADELQHRLNNDAMSNDRAAGQWELETQWALEDGEQTVRKTLAALLNDDPHTDFVAYFAGVADDTRKAGLIVAILDTLLKQPHLPLDQVVRFLERRGDARDAMNDFDGAVADWSLALSLQPDNAQVLNSLGWSFVDHDKNLDLAFVLLTRAVHLAPNDANIRDSLGWAEVKNGKTQDGLKLLQSAAALKPDMAEIVAHLADTYRRLNRNKEASATFARALVLAKSDRVITFIKQQQKLLDSGAAQSSAADPVMHTQ